MKKYLFLLIVIVILSIVFYFYTGFYGFPGKKDKVANQLKEYVEEKYGIEVEIEDKFYDSKSGNYVALFHLKNNVDFSFYAYLKEKDNMVDEYVDKVWEKEIEKDVLPIYEQSFTTLTPGVYLISASDIDIDEELGKNIPSYKDMNTHATFSLDFEDRTTDENVEKIINETYTFISKLKEKGVRNLGLSFYLNSKNDEDLKMANINLEGNEFDQIKTKEDVKKYVKID